MNVEFGKDKKKGAHPHKSYRVCVVLDNIRSAHNVGSAFRTADAAGISHIYLSGYTPAPFDRFGRPRPDIAKVALGAEKTIPWTHVDSTLDLISDLKKSGFMMIGIEQSANAVDYKDIDLSEGVVVNSDRKPCANVAIIFGNEVGGIDPSVLDKCDVVAEIPMRGNKESLNVSVSIGVALFRMLGI